MTCSCLRIVVLLALSALWSSPSARTWYVAADGSGDAPNIPAAVDSSGSGDIVLVGPGTHAIEFEVELKPGTSLISENGPAVTILISGPDPSQVGMVGAHDNCVIRGLTIRGASYATVSIPGVSVEISNNIIENSPFGGIYLQSLTSAIHHNLFYGYGPGIYDTRDSPNNVINNNIIYGGIISSGFPIVYCNDAVDTAQGIALGQSNFSADPMFCGVGNYLLQSDSPCAPGNHPDGYNNCGLIGPLPVGCGNVPVEHRSWGSVKAMYRE